MNILATSDIEGYSLNSIIDLNKENIVCGDILDSTLTGGVPLAYSNHITKSGKGYFGFRKSRY